MTEQYDVLIVGGGMVGATMAHALSPLPLRIGVIEAVPLSAVSQPGYDDRAIALAHGSAQVFEAMGVWSLLARHVSPINKIHVSDRGHFGVTRIDSVAERVAALGYVVESRVVGEVLGEALSKLANVELICPATVTAVTTTGDVAQLAVDCGGVMRELSARLVIAADGGDSAVRSLLQIPTRSWDYRQSAIIANISPDRHHQGVAYERFTDSGPIAMLPNASADDPDRCSLVWTVHREDEQRVLNLSDTAFLTELQTRFGYRLGELRKVGRRNSYPLRLVCAKEHVQPRLALIGNAAHTLHPIAGQGFNLGLRDVAALAQVVAEAHSARHDIGTVAALQRYAQWRSWDHRKVIGLTDTLARLFSNPLAPVVVMRNAGLVAIDVLPPLKRLLARQTMGLSGRLPRLAMGLPLLRPASRP
ncbi:MAG: 2-octaprenyl-6-methoxyphenyl hydroxylase [Pseudomonadota bacterium]|nr:2-octaprenyl-6-methoxyphenyl hydroxylase [Pseudomonadota bacterium]